MLINRAFRIDDIHVPVKRRRTVDPAAVEAIAGSMLEEGQRTPVLLRRDGDRLVLVEGLQRLEACRSLGEETIVGILVRERRNRRAPGPAATAGPLTAARSASPGARAARFPPGRGRAVPATDRSCRSGTGRWNGRTPRGRPRPARRSRIPSPGRRT